MCSRVPYNSTGLWPVFVSVTGRRVRVKEQANKNPEARPMINRKKKTDPKNRLERYDYGNDI